MRKILSVGLSIIMICSNLTFDSVLATDETSIDGSGEASVVENIDNVDNEDVLEDQENDLNPTVEIIDEIQDDPNATGAALEDDQNTMAVADIHSHEDGTTWIGLNSALSSFVVDDNNYVMTSGNYYLEDDLELAMGLIINTDVVVTLCLNDHILSIVEDNPSALLNNEVSDSILTVFGGTLTIMDSEATTQRYWDTETLEIKDGTDGGGTNEFIGGAITGGVNSRNVLGGGAICVSSGTFNLISGNIVGNQTTQNGILGAGVYVNNNATFTMDGGSIIGNISGGNAGGVYVQREGTFIMNGGTIAHNGTALTSNYAGGVYSVGTFTMNGGQIDSNFTLGGGGVSIVYAGYGNSGGIFTMNGGKITNNYASGNSGGILVGSGATFIMNGGEISGNSTNGFGGGIGTRYTDSTVTLHNGVITNNTALGGAAGVHFNAGVLNIGQSIATDNVIITSNTVDNVECNVYLPTGLTITQIGSLSSSSTIGVTKENGIGTVSISSTNPAYSITTSDTASYVPDESYYRILDTDAVILLNSGTIAGTDETIEYTKDAFDVSTLFDLTQRHGEITYTLATTGTGEGVLNNNLLIISKVGTFDIEISTSYTTTAEPKTGTAQLTVTPKGISITDLEAESRPIVEDDYYVTLDETKGSIIGGYDGDNIDIDFSNYIAFINDEDYASNTDLISGTHDFDITVTGLSLKGVDAENYYISSIDETLVTIQTDKLEIVWPTANDIIYGQTQKVDSQLTTGTVTLITTEGKTISIAGTFEWIDPSDEIQEVATYQGNVKFVPTDSEYTELLSGVVGIVEYKVTEVPPPTTLESTDITKSYQADEIDILDLGMFDLTGLGEATYTITPLTGEGNIDGNTIDVTKVGTFEITVTTQATTGNLNGSTGTAILTIIPIEVTISDLVAITRGPIEDYYAVSLDTTSGTINGLINNDEVSIDFSSYSALIEDQNYDDVGNVAYTDGVGKFDVSVDALKLSGADAENYVLVSIDKTTVQIEMAIPYIAWPASTTLTYGQTLKDSSLIGGKVIIKDTDGTYKDITDTGTFQWVNPTDVIQGVGTYTGVVQFVENTSETGSYHDILQATTHDVTYLVEAAEVQFSITNNSVEYGGYVNPSIVVYSSGTAPTPIEGVDYTIVYTQLVDGSYVTVNHPVNIGVYFISADFTLINSDEPSNYIHTGTMVSTGKQIGVLNIYEADNEPQRYDVTFTDFSSYNITDALPQTIHILPTLGSDYLGWETELGVFYDFGSRFPQPEYDVVFNAVKAADNNNITGTVTGTDLDGTTDTTLSNIGVVLMSGNTQVATTETDSNGYYIFNVMPGRYTVEFTRDQNNVKYIESVFVDATQGDAVVDLTFPNGRYNIELNLAAGMESITVDGLQNILSELTNDKTIPNTINFNINQADTTSSIYLEILEAAAYDGLTTDNIKLFYDVQISEEVIESQTTNVDTVETLFEIYIPLSGIYQAKEAYSVYRNDGSFIDVLTTTPNNNGEYIELIDDGKTLVIKAKKSALYAISFIEPEPTILTGKDVSKTYQRDEIDILDLGMFDLTGLGDATYTITPLTGEGVITGTKVDVSKVGTFNVNVITAATSTANAMEGNATLTIEPKSVAVSDLVAISRGPIEGDYYVELDATVEPTVIGVINNDDVSVSFDHSYGKITNKDYTDYDYYSSDGYATFDVTVGGLELSGDDKGNYYIDDMAPTTVIINIDIPYIAWPTAPSINYHEDLTNSTLYGGKVIVLDTTTQTYVELDGEFVWVDEDEDKDGNTISQSNIGTYSQYVKFVENKDSETAPSDTSYRTVLENTTHEVTFTIKATSVQFDISDNDVKFDGTAHYATVDVISSSGKDLLDTEFNIKYYQYIDDVITYIDAPTEVGTYLISGEFTTSNYHHEGTLDYTGKQIGVLNIYENEPTATYSVEFEGYPEFSISNAYVGDIHILPTITDANGNTTSEYTGWLYNGSVYAFGTRFPQPSANATLTAVEAAQTYSLSGTVYGVDLDSTYDALDNIGVAIMQGSEMIMNTETDDDGNFSFDLPAGYYMVVVTRDQVVYNQVTIHVEISNQSVVLEDIILPDTIQNTVVNIASQVTVTSIDGLDSLLEVYAAENEKYSNTLSVNVDPIDLEGIDATEYNAIINLAKESDITTSNLKLFFNINVFREYDGSTTQIYALPDGEYLEIYIPLSGIYQNKGEYQVYRYHEDTSTGEEARVDIITTTENEYGEKLSLSEDGQTLIVKAKYYSTYGVAYIEDKTDSSGSTSSGSTGSSTDTTTYTVTYELNGGKGTLPNTLSYAKDITVTVQSNTVIRDNYIFTGWLNSDNGAVYQANETFKMPTANVVLTAQWSYLYNPVSVPETSDFTQTPLLITLLGFFVAGMLYFRKKQRNL